MAAGHSLDADRVTHASERYGRLLFVVCCFDTAVRTAMKRRIPKCLLENSIASCVLFCQYAGLGRNRHGDSLAVSRERPSLVQRDRRGSRPLGTSRLRSRHTAPETESSTTSLSMSTVADSGWCADTRQAGSPVRVVRCGTRERVRNDDAVEFALTCAGAAILWILRGNESCRRRLYHFCCPSCQESIRRATSASRRSM